MNQISYLQIQEELSSERLSSLQPLNVVILRNVVLEPLEPYLRYMAYQIGFNARCQFGAYDTVYQEAVGGEKELLNEDTDCVLVFLKLETLSWDLARNFAGLSPEQIEAEKERIKDFIGNVLAGIRRQTLAMILWHGFELPLYPALGIVDHQRRTGQTSLVNELNDYLRDALQMQRSAFFVDLNVCRARVGARIFYDTRYWHIGKAPYSREGLQEIANEVAKYIRPLKGKNKKCLVLDCDNILWGGTIGEDGLAGIKLGKSYPGSAHYEFQQEILNLYHRGIILALCSKNNEEDVWDVFRRHPEMVLQMEHIATAQINWRDKAANLRQIALDLNIGLDSIVFVDDSDFEINLIRQILPEVEVLQLPGNRAVEYRDLLAACGWFDSLSLSMEDTQRGAMYKAEAARKKLWIEATDLESYYASLEMVLEIRFADEFSIPRIAQLTQKTNQFNLTTRRYSDADIKHFSDSDSADVLYLRLRDRFGDSGIVGVCLLKYEAEKAIFDSFLLSCRVLGRGVEDAFLVQCINLSRLRGSKLAIGEYLPTAKNEQVKDFYQKQDFKPTAEEGNIRRFALDLVTFARSEPKFFKRIEFEIGK
jgi:FkbH-like protein